MILMGHDRSSVFSPARTKSTIIESHLPCSKCGSSDALAKYSDGHTYCFSCQDYKKGVDKDEIPWYNIKTMPERDIYTVYQGAALGMSKYTSIKEIPGPSWRGIDNATMEHFGVTCRIGEPGNVPISYVFPWGGTSKQIREIAEKRFYMEGSADGADPLFGMSRFPMGSASAITITEGVLDTLSAYQMLGSKYPVVSVRSSSSAKSDCIKAFKYLDSFEKIYIAFDADEPGTKAMKAVASLFDPNKVYIVPFGSPYKDANDYLKDNKVREFQKVWWSSKKHRPKGIVESFDDIKAILEAADALPVATYPFPTLQEMTYGVRLGEVNLITAQEKVGKGLALDTPLPTPTGWTTVGELKVGDTLLTPGGSPTTVTYLSPIVERLNYRITFSDKTSIVSDDVHRWTVRTLGGTVIPTIDTQTMYDSGPMITEKGSKARYMVPVARPVDLPSQPVSIHPFLLGVWLADGNSKDSRITVSTEKRRKLLDRHVTILHEAVNSENSTTIRLAEVTVANLRMYDLINNKHIPDVYLRGSIEQRIQLLNGLMFDGWSRTDRGKQENEYYSSDPALFKQVVELIRSLGYIVTTRSRMGCYAGKDTKTAYSLRFREARWKAIRNIERVETAPTRCLTVDDPSHLFLAGDGWTATHNTAFMSALEYHLIKNTDMNMGIIHLEQSQKRSIQGLLNYEFPAATNLPDSGVSSDDQLAAYTKLVGKEGRVHFYSHFGSDDPDVILDVIRYLVAVCGCKFVFLDHITMLVTGFEGDDERRKLDYLSTRMAMLTRELGFTLFLVSHVNDEGKTRGSRNISKVADLIVHLERDNESESYDVRHTTKLLIKGNRDIASSGPAGYLWFDDKTYTLHEKTPEDVLVDTELAF